MTKQELMKKYNETIAKNWKVTNLRTGGINFFSSKEKAEAYINKYEYLDAHDIAAPSTSVVKEYGFNI